VRYMSTYFQTDPPNSVADVQSFELTNDGHDVILEFEIQGGADPNEYAAVYVSDNPLGPALLIDALTAHAALMPGSNQWVDNLRLPPADQYYYWLDYDDQPFAAKRAPQELYPATNVPVFVSGTSFTGFAPPTIVSIVDTPFDQGWSVTLNWSAPNGHEDADGFNIYRHSYPGGQPEYDEWRVIGWTDPYTLSYPDMAPTGWVNEYKVSIAHHGNSVPQTGDGNTGIWNSFSSVVAGAPIDNFAIDQIALLSNDTLRVCPAGHDGTLEVEEIIWGNVGGPTVGIPPEMLVCYLEADSVITCDGDALVVDGPTDGAGRTTLTASKIGGHGRADLVFALANSHTTFDTVTVYFKSPDENGDGVVSVSDMAAWSMSFQSPPKTYKWFRDFNGGGSITMGDFAYIGAHYGHECASGAAATLAAKVTASQGRLRLDVEEDQPLLGEHKIRATIILEDMEPFSTAVIALGNENEVLNFSSWNPDPSLEGLALCSDIVRDGTRQVFIGVFLEGLSSASEIRIGTAEFVVASAEPLNLTEQDFELVAGDILSAPPTVSTSANQQQLSLTGRRLTMTPPTYKNELAQNYPNPFNPTTTIAFSVEKDVTVDLRIYDVRGAAVRTLANERYQAGVHRLAWDGQTDRGQPVASGVYFYKLVAGSFTDTKKMTILK
jgi:hypothetical protein